MDNNTALYAFRKYGDTVLRAAYACCGNYSEAEDITQDVFLILHSNPQDFESDEHMKAWLIRVAINMCKNLLKSACRNRQVSLEEQQEKGCDYAYCDGDEKEQKEEILQAILNIKPVFREVIYLYYYEGYNTKEIGKIVGKNASTIRSRLAKEREILEQILKEEMEYEKTDS